MDKETQMRRSTIFSALVLAGAIASPTLVLAQTNPTSVDDQDTTAVRDNVAASDRSDGNDWGWLGLIGLAGLAGLRRRDREELRDPVRTRQPGQPA